MLFVFMFDKCQQKNNVPDFLFALVILFIPSEKKHIVIRYIIGYFGKEMLRNIGF